MLLFVLASLLLDRMLAMAFGLYSCSSAASRIFLRRSLEIEASGVKARDTADWLTPMRRANSRAVMGFRLATVVIHAPCRTPDPSTGPGLASDGNAGGGSRSTRVAS